MCWWRADFSVQRKRDGCARLPRRKAGTRPTWIYGIRALYVYPSIAWGLSACTIFLITISHDFKWNLVFEQRIFSDIPVTMVIHSKISYGRIFSKCRSAAILCELTIWNLLCARNYYSSHAAGGYVTYDACRMET